MRMKAGMSSPKPTVASLSWRCRAGRLSRCGLVSPRSAARCSLRSGETLRSVFSERIDSLRARRSLISATTVSAVTGCSRRRIRYCLLALLWHAVSRGWLRSCPCCRPCGRRGAARHGHGGIVLAALAGDDCRQVAVMPLDLGTDQPFDGVDVFGVRFGRDRERFSRTPQARPVRPIRWT